LRGAEHPLVTAFVQAAMNQSARHEPRLVRGRP
jgi:hypothetical protein